MNPIFGKPIRYLGAIALVFGLGTSVQAQTEETPLTGPNESQSEIIFEPASNSAEPLQPVPAEADDFQSQRDIDLGRATRSGSSYIGIGANIGIGEGDTAIGETSFAVLSKIGITRNLSVRPGVLISDDPTILVPVTFDFIPVVSETTADVTEEVAGLRVNPYVGAGAAISVGDDAAVDFLATGGVDVPLSRQITATAALNASLFENPAVGVTLGVGYNFDLSR
ncbi:MAG: hypothetical protein ACFB4I_23740 [Cyanophyceae cyanobacterium]